MPVSQSSIAQHLGVSQRTVSSALSDSGRLSPEVRARIIREAAMLGYRPNRLAKALRDGQTRSIGVIWLHANPWTDDAIIALDLQRSFQANEYAVYNAQYSSDMHILCGQIDDMLSRRIDALILWASPSILESPKLAAYWKEIDTVIAVTRSAVTDFPGDLVVHDRTLAIHQVVDHFAASGRRRPAMALCLEEESNPPKYRAFLNRCQQHGIGDHPHTLISLPPLEEPASMGLVTQQGFCRAFPGMVDVDAIYCFNDISALYIIRELSARGIRVPEDVAVVGFNNHEVGPIWTPPLASGDRKPHEVSRQVTAMFARRLESPDLPPQRATVHMEFLWRESAGGSGTLGADM